MIQDNTTKLQRFSPPSRHLQLPHTDKSESKPDLGLAGHREKDRVSLGKVLSGVGLLASTALLAACGGGTATPHNPSCLETAAQQNDNSGNIDLATQECVVGEFVVDAQGRKLTPGSSEGGIGADVNENGDYIAATNYGILVGNINDGNTAKFLTDANGRNLTPGSSEGGIGAAINDKGQFVAATNYGTVVGDIDEGNIGHFLTDAGGRKLTPGSSEGGIGADINEHGQFILSLIHISEPTRPY